MPVPTQQADGVVITGRGTSEGPRDSIRTKPHITIPNDYAEGGSRTDGRCGSTNQQVQVERYFENVSAAEDAKHIAVSTIQRGVDRKDEALNVRRKQLLSEMEDSQIQQSSQDSASVPLRTKDDTDRVIQDCVHFSQVVPLPHKRKAKSPDFSTKRVRLLSECSKPLLEDARPNSSSDEKTTSDEGHEEWYPGDGVCPPTLHFNAVYQSSYKAWCSAASRMVPCDLSKPFLSDAFLNMVQDVPEFFRNPPENVDIRGGNKFPLTLRSSLHLLTTDDWECERSWKTIDYIQCLGFPEPVTYTSESETSSSSPFPFEPTRDRSGHLASITLAWSYIISCRWVEILQHAGEKGSLRHDRGEQITTNFWGLVLQSRWEAQVETRKGTSCSPWMLRKGNSETQRSHDMIQIEPNSSLAFDILTESCADLGLEQEYLIGFATILMLTSRNAPQPKLAVPVEISGSFLPSRKRDIQSERLYRSIDKCMTISSTQDAFDSLLCSAFFDPKIPCNLVGAASLGVTMALLQVEMDYARLLHAISERTPYLSLLWVAVVCNGQAKHMLNMALQMLPPICLVAAVWTNTIQSFLQVTYSLPSSVEDSVSRSCEFSTSYFCRPEASEPWTHAPPFGSTRTRNLSLEVEEHYRHNHKPLWWGVFWILPSGERVPFGSQKRIQPRQVHSWEEEQNIHPECGDQTQVDMQMTWLGVNIPGLRVPFQQRKMAEEQSWNATSRLFNWHRHHDDGLWLDDGMTEDIETIRILQQHPWVVDPFDDSGQSDLLEEGKDALADGDRILQWMAKVE